MYSPKNELKIWPFFLSESFFLNHQRPALNTVGILEPKQKNPGLSWPSEFVLK